MKEIQNTKYKTMHKLITSVIIGCFTGWITGYLINLIYTTYLAYHININIIIFEIYKFIKSELIVMMTMTVIMAWLSVLILLVRIIWVRIMFCIMYILRKLFGIRIHDQINRDHRADIYDIYAGYIRIKDYMILR
jgi:hypothetical protein